MDQKELEALQRKYKLTEEEYEAYYKSVILYFTTGRKTEGRPRLVIVAGQPGAGKSKLIPVEFENLNYNAVILDYDVIRSMHPKFDSVSEEDKNNIHWALVPDADRANIELRKYCKNNKLNLIYEGTMRVTEGFVNMAKEFKEAGYDIDLELMAVPGIESYSATFLRYATDLLTDNKPRFISKSFHDTCYRNLLVTLDRFQNEGLFDYATVYRRGESRDNPIPFYTTEGGKLAKLNDAVVYGREHFKEAFIKRFPHEYVVIHTVFSESAPELLPYVEELPELYKQEINEDKSNMDFEDLSGCR